MMISLDGYFEGPNHELDWHHVDEEFNDFAIEQLNEIDTIIFGKVTYEMMASYWPTEAGIKDDPGTAEKMNSLPKIVFSKTDLKPEWNNTKLMQDVQDLKALKEQPGKDLAVFGSSNLCVSLIKAGLLDGIRVMVNPVVLGQGHTLFAGLDQKLELKLEKSREFKNGNVLLTYEVK